MTGHHLVIVVPELARASASSFLHNFFKEISDRRDGHKQGQNLALCASSCVPDGRIILFLRRFVYVLFP